MTILALHIYPLKIQAVIVSTRAHQKYKTNNINFDISLLLTIRIEASFMKFDIASLHGVYMEKKYWNNNIFKFLWFL